MRPKIVILSAFLTPFRSGAEACAEEMPLRLADQFDFTIVTARLRRDLPKKDLLQGRIPIIRVGFGCSCDKWLYPFLAPLVVRKLKPDIVHGILETFAGLALHFCKFTCSKARRVLTLQTTNRNFLKGMIVRSPDAVTVISSYMMHIAEKLGRNDVTLIPNGIDYASFERARAQHKKIAGRVLFVGRAETVKGIDDVIEAFLGVRAEQTAATLHIVGSGSLLSRLIQEHDGRSGIEVLAALQGQELLREYAQAEVFCGLSKSEAMGNVFIEAQAAGCAVVATNVGGIPENVSGGIIVESGNVQAATDAIGVLLRDPEMSQNLAERGIRMAERFDWGGLSETYANIYLNLVK